MKKLLAVVLAFTLLIAVACAEAADVAGTWYLNALIMNGTTLSPAAFGVEMSITLKEDGVAIAETTNEAGSGEGTWSIAGDTVTVVIDDQPLDLTFRDSELVADPGTQTMIFGREKSVAKAFEPAPPVAAEIDDFAGEWETYQVCISGVYYDTAVLDEAITASIRDGTVTMNGFLFSETRFETALSDGALVFQAEDAESVLFDALTFRMLEDGSLSLSLNTGADDVVFIMRSAG